MNLFFKLQFFISSYDSVKTSCESVISNYEFVITSYDLAISSCESVITRYESVISSHESEFQDANLLF